MCGLLDRVETGFLYEHLRVASWYEPTPQGLGLILAIRISPFRGSAVGDVSLRTKDIEAPLLPSELAFDGDLVGVYAASVYALLYQSVTSHSVLSPTTVETVSQCPDGASSSSKGVLSDHKRDTGRCSFHRMGLVFPHILGTCCTAWMARFGLLEGLKNAIVSNGELFSTPYDALPGPRSSSRGAWCHSPPALRFHAVFSTTVFPTSLVHTL
ncbi:hypothetical protein QBC35DRAFT_272634 [Podospora australis]|uniref:Uncharacterized protein n=1 Tax=Podospora australis TaxID=1536484 RepID=A0AAN6WQ85_9PEZI|nr:hypothetical protein QBC35DRAFT_272634 [Podospora australis]